MVGERGEERFSKVSPSGLPTLEQCPRYYAIQRDYRAARKAHPDLPEDGKTVPLIFGSAFHKVVEDKCRNSEEVSKTLDGVLGGSDPEYDSVYSGRGDVVKGLLVALKAFLNSPESAPWRDDSAKMVEERMEARVEGMKITGIVDCVDGDGQVIDIKTTTPRADSEYGSQLTAYWMLARANSEGIGDDAAVLKVFRPYGPKGKSGVASERLSAKANERHVRGLLRLAKRIGKTREKWSDDYTKLPCNPGAKRCRYCPARMTSACPETRRW